MTRFVFGGSTLDMVFVPPRVDGGSLSGRIGLAYTIYLDADATALCPITDLSGNPISDSVVRTTADSLFGAFLTVDPTLTVVYATTPGGETVRVYADVPGRLAELELDALRRGSNLADLDTPAAARDNLGLGTAATHAATDFDPAGAAAAAQAGAQAASIPLTQKGAASGVAELDAGGKLPSFRMPPIAINDTFTVASQAAMLALTAQRGDVAVRTDLIPAETFILAGDDPTVLGNWIQITTPGAVTSVDGQTGVVDLSTIYQVALNPLPGDPWDVLFKNPAGGGIVGWRKPSQVVARSIRWVLLSDYMRSDGIVDDAGMAAAVAATIALGAGTTLWVNPGVYAASTKVDGNGFGGCRVAGSGNLSVLEQHTWGQPLFDFYGPNGTVDDITVERVFLRGTTTSRSDIPGAFRGENTSSYCAGVLSVGNRGRFLDLRVEGFVAGVHPTNISYNADPTAATRDLVNNRTGNVIRNLEVANVDYGILSVGQTRPRYDGISGSYVQSQQADPPHLVYMVDSTIGVTSHVNPIVTNLSAVGVSSLLASVTADDVAPNNNDVTVDTTASLYVGQTVTLRTRSTNVGVAYSRKITAIAGNVVTLDGRAFAETTAMGLYSVTGHALACKGVTAGIISNVSAYNCGGVAVFHNVVDSLVHSLSQQGDAGEGDADDPYAFKVDSTCKRNRVANIRVKMSASTRAVLLSGDDNVYDGGTVRSNRSATTTDYDISIQGNRNLVRGWGVPADGSTGVAFGVTGVKQLTTLTGANSGNDLPLTSATSVTLGSVVSLYTATGVNRWAGRTVTAITGSTVTAARRVGGVTLTDAGPTNTVRIGPTSAAALDVGMAVDIRAATTMTARATARTITAIDLRTGDLTLDGAAFTGLLSSDSVYRTDDIVAAVTGDVFYLGSNTALALGGHRIVDATTTGNDRLLVFNAGASGNTLIYDPAAISVTNATPVDMQETNNTIVPRSVAPYRAEITALSPYIVSSGTVTLTTDTTAWGGVRRDSGAAAPSGNQIGWDVVLAPGTYTLELTHTTSGDRGIYSIYLDGVLISNTIDGYSAAAVRNVRSTVTGITVPASSVTGVRRLLIKMETQNASATGNYKFSIQYLALMRTGA